jgi:hypothetical protein
MIYSEEKADVIINRVDFLEIHYDELALHKDTIPLNPDYDRYLSLESKNQLKIYTLRTDEHILIGYAVFFISPMIHYKSTICATNDLLYISKEYRQGMTGIKFIKYCETKLHEHGVHKITWHIKESNNFIPILKRMGYITEDIIVGKVLKYD